MTETEQQTPSQIMAERIRGFASPAASAASTGDGVPPAGEGSGDSPAGGDDPAGPPDMNALMRGLRRANPIPGHIFGRTTTDGDD